MPRFVKRSVILGIVWVATQVAAPQGVAPPAALGADHDFPVVNSIGRFFGVGYTKGGYHAAQDSRLNVISNRHPASDYRMVGLPQYSQPQYHPPRSVVGAAASPMLAPDPAGGAARPSGRSTVSPSNTADKNKAAAPQADAPSNPEALSQPPPPRWLEEYLQQSEADKLHEIPPPQESLLEESKDIAPASSPSDLLFDEPSAELELGHEVGFSILDSDFPAPVYRAPAPASATRPTNRYR